MSNIPYCPEHHPSCPLFNSFDLGEVPNKDDCKCTECTYCFGRGVLIDYEEEGDSVLIDCPQCQAAGRLMVIVKDRYDTHGSLGSMSKAMEYAEKIGE